VRLERKHLTLREQSHLYEDREAMDLPDRHAALDRVLRTNWDLRTHPINICHLWLEAASSVDGALLQAPDQQKQPTIAPMLSRDLQAEGANIVAHCKEQERYATKLTS
jgi:hypothetical protein